MGVKRTLTVAVVMQAGNRVAAAAAANPEAHTCRKNRDTRSATARPPFLPHLPLQQKVRQWANLHNRKRLCKQRVPEGLVCACQLC